MHLSSLVTLYRLAMRQLDYPKVHLPEYYEGKIQIVYLSLGLPRSLSYPGLRSLREKWEVTDLALGVGRPRKMMKRWSRDEGMEIFELLLLSSRTPIFTHYSLLIRIYLICNPSIKEWMVIQLVRTCDFQCSSMTAESLANLQAQGLELLPAGLLRGEPRGPDSPTNSNHDRFDSIFEIVQSVLFKSSK